ncbi:hypothetical protein [Streptomyces sp. NPDC101234]|uniref:hypothetical protein n=1 Tax=Streptomyces sp. NPDC101234 TaxID=3366138 RepID=UPI003830796D
MIFRSRSREENPRWTNFHEYYGFTPFYCEPGLRSAHEKGGVEGTFTAVHEAFWAAAEKALGDTEGTKDLVKVLLLHRHQQHADVVIGIRAALAAGTFNEDVIAMEARKAAQPAGRAPTVTASTPALEPLDLAPAPVTPLTRRHLARALPADQRPRPRLEQ